MKSVDYDKKNRVYLFEFKLDDTAQTALARFHQKSYGEGSRGRAKTIYLVGVGFDSRRRTPRTDTQFSLQSHP